MRAPGLLVAWLVTGIAALLIGSVAGLILLAVAVALMLVWFGHQPARAILGAHPDRR